MKAAARLPVLIPSHSLKSILHSDNKTAPHRLDPESHSQSMESVHHVAAIPYPGRGHINPMMNLCRLLASNGLLVTVIVTDEWRNILTGGAPQLPPNLRLRSITDVLPSEKIRGNDIRGFFRDIYTKMEAPVEAAIGGLETPVDSILTDSALVWAAAIGRRRSLPVFSLWTQSAATFLALVTFSGLDAAGKLPVDYADEEKEHLAYMPRFLQKSPALQFNLSNIQISRLILEGFPTAQALLSTSFYDLEKEAIETLKTHLQVPLYSVGPTIPYMTLSSHADTPPISYLKWLDSQPVNSVLYVSLGSFLPFTGPQMHAMAAGLEASGSRFLWVMHGVEESNTSTGNGLMVPWCEQLQVLCHPSIGGFLTHCGWNSTLEGVFAGAPMLTFPLIWDQYPNSRLIVDDWRVGLRLKDEKAEDRVVGQEEIAGMVRELMDLHGEENLGMRRRSKEVRDKCRKALEEGGSSYTDLNVVVQEMVNKKMREGYSPA